MESIKTMYKSVTLQNIKHWYKVGPTNDFPENGGLCVKYKNMQIAVFNFTRQNKWYACQNLCPHRMEMVISRGMIGEDDGLAKIACPLHKKTFSLEDGCSLNDEDLSIAVFPVKIEKEIVYIGFEN